MQTPNSPLIFDWPDEPLTPDGKLAYPRTRNTKLFGAGARLFAARPFATRPIEAIQRLVAVCIDVTDPNVGNVVPLIAAELNTSFAEKERALLPEVDYVYPYYDISEECKIMLHNKLSRAQRQHAHDLAVKDMVRSYHRNSCFEASLTESQVDIVITWKCDKVTFPDATDYPLKRTINMTPPDAKLLNEAWTCHYKKLDWDKMHVSARITGVRPERKGGFYACVSMEDYYSLLDMAERYGDKIQVSVIVAPKHMTAAEEKEMEDYYKLRSGAREGVDACGESNLDANKHQHTYSQVQQQDLGVHQRMDFRVGS